MLVFPNALTRHQPQVLYSLFLLLCLFIFGYPGSSLLWGLFSSCGTQTSHHGFLQLRYIDFSSWWLFLLQSVGCRVLGPQWLWHMGSVAAAPGLWSTGSTVVAHGLSCSTACGIFLDWRSNQCLLHWQVDSLPLSHQGSPISPTLEL